MILRLFLIELMVSVLIAAIPVAYSFYAEGPKGLERMFSALIPPAFLMFYSMGLTVAAVAVEMADRILLKSSDAQINKWRMISEIFSQVSSGIQTILRLITGAFLTFVGIWAIFESNTLSWGKASVLLMYGLIALAESTAVAVFLQWIPKRWGHSSRKQPLFEYHSG